MSKQIARIQKEVLQKMNTLSRMRLQTLRWWYGVPLPAHEADTTPIFHSWYRFDPSANKWISLESSSKSTTTGTGYNNPSNDNDGKFVLVTWNVDATSPAPKARIAAIISQIQNLATPADVIFLQEVSKSAMLALLEMPWLREHWYMSEAGTTNWGKQSFASVTLVSKARFASVGTGTGTDSQQASLGPIWRVKYPSRFEREALCCDILLPSKSHGPGSGNNNDDNPRRVRLVNVHLDSLPINPSLRPRQLSIVSSYLRAAGQGLVAGDFNPVFPEDNTLVGANGLFDAWSELRSNEAGYTWNPNGEPPFPPGRFDKMAVVGLKPCDIEVLAAGEVDLNGTSSLKREEHGQERDSKSLVRWSDHSGLVCSFAYRGFQNR